MVRCGHRERVLAGEVVKERTFGHARSRTQIVDGGCTEPLCADDIDGDVEQPKAGSTSFRMVDGDHDEQHTN